MSKEPYEYLPTVPATQVCFLTTKSWCAGHGWRWRRGLGWVHHWGHRLRLLRVVDELPPPPRGYVGG